MGPYSYYDEYLRANREASRFAGEASLQGKVAVRFSQMLVSTVDQLNDVKAENRRLQIAKDKLAEENTKLSQRIAELVAEKNESKPGLINYPVKKLGKNLKQHVEIKRDLFKVGDLIIATNKGFPERKYRVLIDEVLPGAIKGLYAVNRIPRDNWDNRGFFPDEAYTFKVIS